MAFLQTKEGDQKMNIKNILIGIVLLVVTVILLIFLPYLLPLFLPLGLFGLKLMGVPIE